MGIGKKFVKDHLAKYPKEVARIAKKSNKEFFNWFHETGGDVDVTFIRGNWDFITFIAYPLVKYLKEPEKKIALDIGYGAGRLLAGASRAFKKVIGIEIFENEIIGQELKRRGINNFELLKTNGIDMPLQDNSIDVVYSMITFQHFEKPEIFEGYISESFRVLKRGGLAVLYFGRWTYFSAGRKSYLLYLLDMFLENFFLHGGYKQRVAKINMINLFVSLRKAKKVSKKAGFEILEHIVSRKNIPDDYALYGQQYGLVIRKP